MNTSVRSPVLCNHANECPRVCPCDADCYCKQTMCRDAMPQAEYDRLRALGWEGQPSRPPVDLVIRLQHRLALMEMRLQRQERELAALRARGTRRR